MSQAPSKTIISYNHHGFKAGDIVNIFGGYFVVTEVTDECSFTLRRMRWWERAWLMVKRAWKALVRCIAKGGLCGMR